MLCHGVLWTIKVGNYCFTLFYLFVINRGEKSIENISESNSTSKNVLPSLSLHEYCEFLSKCLRVEELLFPILKANFTRAVAVVFEI